MDVNRYVGVPWKVGGRSLEGADCWGLVMTIYDQEYNVKLNDFLDDEESPVVAIEIGGPKDGCLIRGVNCTNGADHWGFYWKGRVIQASNPHSSAPKLKQFVCRWPVVEFYEVHVCV